MVAYAGTREKVAWILAPSLVGLETQLNARWTKRSRKSDGSIGDAAHAKRKSEHNPQPVQGMPANPQVVCALDITVDLDGDGLMDDALDCSFLLAHLIAHEATWYVIYNGYIYTRKNRFVPVKYTGADPHTGHFHISILPYVGAVTNTDPWFPNIPEVDDMPYTPEQLQNILLDAPVQNKWGEVHKLRDILAAMDFNVVQVGDAVKQVPDVVVAQIGETVAESVAEKTVDELLDHPVQAMDPATGKAKETRLEEVFTRASEATVVRQAEKITSAKSPGTATEMLAALKTRLEDGKVVAIDPRSSGSSDKKS